MPTARMRKHRTDTWEADPPKTIAERLSSVASIHGVDPSQDGRGGVPELSAHEFQARICGSGDPLGQAAAALRILDETQRMPEVVRALHLWGWLQWMKRGRRQSIQAPLHERLAALAVTEFYERRRRARDERIEFLNIGPQRWERLASHYADMVSRLLQGESRVLAHVVRYRNDTEEGVASP